MSNLKVPFAESERTSPSQKRMFRNAAIAHELYYNQNMKQGKIAEQINFSAPYVSSLIQWYGEYLKWLGDKEKPAVPEPVLPVVEIKPPKKPDPIGVDDIAIVAYLALNEIFPINMQAPESGGYRYLWLFEDNEKVNDRIKQYFEMSDRIFPIHFAAEMRRLQKELKAFRGGMHHTFKNLNYKDQENESELVSKTL